MIRAQIDGQTVQIHDALIEKYSRPGPRYTSYPTAPNWEKNFGPSDFYKALQESNTPDPRTKIRRPISLYFHLPFCEERCTFCACSVVATKRHDLVTPYLKALLREIDIVSEALDPSRKVTQIHWGGGTPTYLSSAEISQLMNHTARRFSIASDAEISVEIDPRVTTDEQLITLREAGFNRASLGVQDFDPEVQELAGRIQSESQTRHTLLTARALGFQSANIDLVYGLPKQSPPRFAATLEKILALDPDRIALFNFAYVPWMHAHQRKISANDLPSPHTKLEMFCRAVEFFENAGYEFIGLDHFAKKSDEMAQAKRNGTMYRNFQGYTTHRDCDLIGMGVTSISSVHNAFAQNAKKLVDYQNKISQSGLTTHTGLKLSAEDLQRQAIIRELFCHQRAAIPENFGVERKKMEMMEEDGLVAWNDGTLNVTPLGRFFLRNIGMVFDAYLKTEQKKFSGTV